MISWSIDWLNHIVITLINYYHFNTTSCKNTHIDMYILNVLKAPSTGFSWTQLTWWTKHLSKDKITLRGDLSAFWLPSRCLDENAEIHSNWMKKCKKNHFNEKPNMSNFSKCIGLHKCWLLVYLLITSRFSSNWLKFRSSFLKLFHM